MGHKFYLAYFLSFGCHNYLLGYNLANSWNYEGHFDYCMHSAPFFQNILLKHQGKKILIDIWASWCRDCVVTLPELKKLQQENLSRKEMGRDAFLDRVWQWKEASGDTIKGQMRRMGCSTDWSRSRFTMDEGFSKAVNKVFVQLSKTLL